MADEDLKSRRRLSERDVEKSGPGNAKMMHAVYGDETGQQFVKGILGHIFGRSNSADTQKGVNRYSRVPLPADVACQGLRAHEPGGLHTDGLIIPPLQKFLPYLPPLPHAMLLQTLQEFACCQANIAFTLPRHNAVLGLR